MDPHVDGWSHTYVHAHTHHSSLLFSVNCNFHVGHCGKGQRLDMRKEGEAPSATSGMRFKTIRERTHQVITNKSRKQETAVNKEDFNYFRGKGRKHRNLTQVKAQ